jgi:hypothetical protein
MHSASLRMYGQQLPAQGYGQLGRVEIGVMGQTARCELTLQKW